MKRLMLDTCVVIDMLMDPDGLDSSVVDLLEDPENAKTTAATVQCDVTVAAVFAILLRS